MSRLDAPTTLLARRALDLVPRARVVAQRRSGRPWSRTERDLVGQAAVALALLALHGRWRSHQLEAGPPGYACGQGPQRQSLYGWFDIRAAKDLAKAPSRRTVPKDLAQRLALVERQLAAAVGIRLKTGAPGSANGWGPGSRASTAALVESRTKGRLLEDRSQEP